MHDSFIDTSVGPEDDHDTRVPAGNSSATNHGRYASLSALRTVRDLVNEVSGAQQLSYDLSGQALVDVFDSTVLEMPTRSIMAAFASLPSRQKLRQTVEIASIVR